MVEAVPKADCNTRSFDILWAGRLQPCHSDWQGKCLFMYMYIHAYIYTVLSSTRAQAGALVHVPLLKCSLAAFCPPSPSRLPARGYSNWGRASPLSFGGRECSHTGTGSRQRQLDKPHWGTSAGATEASGTSPGIAQPGVLSRKAFLQRAPNHSQKQGRPILQHTSLVAPALRKTCSCTQVSPFKSSSMTDSKELPVGSRLLSTCSLWVLD